MTFLIRVAATLMSIVFLIGLGYYAMYTAQQTYLRIKGADTTPAFDVKTLTNQVIYWLSAGFAAVILIMVAVLAVRGVAASRRLLGVVPFKDFQKHLLVLGPTGSGKTNTAKQAITMALKNNVEVVVLDWKGEYTTFIEGATIIRKLNPWDVGGRSAKEKAAIAVELLREITRDIADVSSASAALLLRELVKLYQRGVPKTSDVVDALETFFKTAMAERRLAEANMAAALQRRLLWLQIDEEREAHNTVRSPTVTIYDMSQLGSVYLKTVYSLVALTKAYYEAVTEGQTLSLRRLVVAEECQNYVRGRRFDEPPSIGERIVNELRAYGVGVLLISPDPVQIPWHLSRDVAATVAISLQAVPDALKDIFRAYDIRRLERILRGRKTYVFHNGKLHMVRTPKTLRPLKLKYVPPPPPETELPQQQVAPQPVVVSVEEQSKTEEPLRLEEEEEQPSPAPTAVEKVEVEDREPLPQALKKAGEEASQTEPLRLEEEEVEEVEEASPTEQPAEDYVKEVVFPLGDHLVAETPDSTGETTTLTCVKCGLTAPLTDSEKMANTDCGAKQSQQTKPEDVRCVVCGNPASKTAPFWNSSTMAVEIRNVCDGCYNDWLRLLRKGPETKPRVYGRGRGYYFLPLNTWFEEIAGAWPCPACEEFFDSFAEVVNHFAEKHPDKSKPLEEIEVDINGKRVKAYRCWQGIYCPCGYLTDNENHFRHHYRREHPEAMR